MKRKADEVYQAGKTFDAGVHHRWLYLFAVVLILGLGLLPGCANFMDNPYFTVKESGLNWITIRHYNYRTTPMQRVSLRLDGNGFVTVREGSSLLVANPFAAGHEDANWGDIRETRVTIAREEMNRIFQVLVNQGLFAERRKGRSVNTNEAIFVAANIQNKTCGSPDDVFGADPDLAEHLKNVVLMFYHPQPRRRQSR